MTRRRRQKDIEIAPVLVLLLFGLGFGIYQSQESLVLIISILLSIVIITGIILYLINRDRQDRLRRSGIEQIDLMSGLEFERYLQVLLSKSGFRNVSKPSIDLGVDLVASKNGYTWAIQAKRYKGAVGLDSVRQVVAAMSHYKCDKAMVITNSYFTKNARTIAASTNCTLLDRDGLIDLVLAQTSSPNTR